MRTTGPGNVETRVRVSVPRHRIEAHAGSTVCVDLDRVDEKPGQRTCEQQTSPATVLVCQSSNASEDKGSVEGVNSVDRKRRADNPLECGVVINSPMRVRSRRSDQIIVRATQRFVSHSKRQLAAVTTA